MKVSGAVDVKRGTGEEKKSGRRGVVEKKSEKRYLI